MSEAINTVEINGVSYPIDDLSERAQTIINRLVYIRNETARLVQQTDILMAAEAKLNEVLNKELEEDEDNGDSE